MNLIADILLVAGALGAGIYCFVLARRLAKFNDLEAGVGGAVAVLSAQVDDMTRTLKAAQGTAGKSTEKLEALTQRAEGVSKRLELMLAAMHDLQEEENASKDKVESDVPEVTEPEAEAEIPAEDAPAEETKAASDAAEETRDDEDWARIQAEAIAAEERKLLRRAKKKAKKKAKRKAAMALAAMQAEAAAPASSEASAAESSEPEAGPMFKRHIA